MIAITGGAGFIGSNLCDFLSSDGHEVLVIDDLSSGSAENVPGRARLVRKDILSDLSGELRGVETLFHYAAEQSVRGSLERPEKTLQANVSGTMSVLESCRKSGVSSFVFASSSAVYGPAPVPTPETHPCSPISVYGASKAAAESVIRAYSECYGMKCTILRYANIFGPRSKHGVIHDFSAKLRKDPSVLEIFGDGNQDKSYLYVSDCVAATVTAWKRQSARMDVFNVGTRRTAKVHEIARMLASIIPADPRIIKKEGWIGDVQRMLLDTSKIESLGWTEKVGLEEGMRLYLSSLDGG